MKSDLNNIMSSKNKDFKLKRKNIDSKTEIQPKKKKKLNLSKEPKLNEINNLKDIEILHHSNIFRLQIQEIIQETSHNSKTEEIINIWINSFNEWIKSKIKPSQKFNMYDLSWLKNLKITYPSIKLPVEEKKFEPFQFFPPELITNVGSYKNGTSLYPIFNIDLLIEIPKKCILVSDWKNGKYFIKRTLYLCYFAHLLKNNKSIKNVEFFYRDADPLKICLLINPIWNCEQLLNINICLDVVPPSEHFKLDRFLPNKNNIRSDFLINESLTCSSPYYNGSFLLDLTAMKNNILIFDKITPYKSLQDAIKLLKIWIKQRNLDNGPGGFNGYIISMYVVYLCNLKKITPAMSSYQIMRSSLVNLVGSNWCENGLIFEPNNIKHKNILKLMHHYYQVVFLDPTGQVNLCHRMTKHLFYRLKLEADHAIKLMDSTSTTCFQDLFIDKISENLYFDEIIKINSIDKIKSFLMKSECEMKRLEAPLFNYEFCQSMILELLQRAIGDRCLLICPINNSNTNSWPIDKFNSNSSLCFGILIENFDTCFNLMTIGPVPGDPQVELFNQFWGDKVQLRRFKDGTICETISWTDNQNVSTSIKRNIIKRIVGHIFKLHLNLRKNDYTHFNCELMEIFSQPWYEKNTTGEEALREVVDIFESLARDISSLENLPIPISSVRALSASLRYTETIPIQYANGYDLKWLKCSLENDTELPKIRYVHPHEAIINLGISNKWPKDYDSVQRIKKAFQLEIANAIQSQLKLQIRNYIDYFDVYKEGFVYRLSVAYSREPNLLRTHNMPDGRIVHESNPEADNLERAIVHLPQITTALRGVQQRFNSFGPCCRLAKRWLRSQFLDDTHLSDITIEMLVASLFLSPGPFKPPQQPQIAFFRFLQLLSKNDLSIKPILLNFNDEMTSEDMAEAESHCSSSKRATHGPPLFIATQWDLSGEMWTKHSPSAPVLLRIRGLAQGAFQLLNKYYLTSNSQQQHYNFKSIFTHITNNYDIKLELDTTYLPCLLPDIDMKWKDCMITHNKYSKKMPIVGSNPAKDYIHRLRESYSEVALFFYNPYIPKEIGIILNKKIKELLELDNHKQNKKMNKQKSKNFCIGLFVEDIMEIGKNIVKTSNICYACK